MANLYFLFDGKNSLDYSIRMLRPMEFSAPVPRIEKEPVPARNGEVLRYDQSYENVTASANCYVLSWDIPTALARANEFLLENKGYLRLETSLEPDYFRLAAVTQGVLTQQTAQRYAPFQIQFTCKPQKFLKLGEEAVSLSTPGSIHNPTPYTAAPLITVYGTGEGSVTVGARTVAFTAIDDEITIDCESGESYHVSPDDPRDSVTTGYIFPALDPGENNVSWSGGITKVKVIPRWFVL